MDEPSESYSFEAARLRDLFLILQNKGYRVAGPYLQNGAVAFGYLERFEQLPVGCHDSQDPGRYRLEKSQSSAFFHYAVGPHSIKNILHPARRKLWEASRTASEALSFHATPQADSAVALFGIRSCDIQALQVLDRVFLDAGYTDEHYAALREKLLIVAVNCAQPSALCFCASMGIGPVPSHVDLQLTEVYEADQHFFVVRAGNAKGADILSAMQLPAADGPQREAAHATVARGQARLKKKLNTEDLPSILKANPLHARWDEVANRCLSCGNCTMVCPTCFCTTTEDVTDLQGEHSERWLHWDSCFTADFSYIHGGHVRKSTASRYRQWLTHKLSTWHDQFGSSGCVGCGRCIAWCPVGIDLTEEASAIRGNP
jgi:ferredoxin